MDSRAYHLQNLAHIEVALALKSGRLLRHPCEVCGQKGQAHHDSYYPEKWLDVRWLCSAHHRQWHVENEPEWPTIFEYHPSDEEVVGRMRARGKKRQPWFRKSKGRWYVWHEGKQVNLGADKEEAFRRFSNLNPGITRGTKNANQAGETVRTV